mmetsp:Transcript_85978/g.135755  ORF Transcript_85978/g.135755 Transcript_85978/m.135755 type:complete len:161 (+) Transcript_85978:271-753(+)
MGKNLGVKEMQDRYVAILVPTEMSDWPAAKKYQCSFLAYWDTRQSFLQGLEPKGKVSLGRIVKVKHEEEENNGRGVAIEHRKVQDDARHDFMLWKEDRIMARQFACLLNEFVDRIKKHWKEDEESPEVSPRSPRRTRKRSSLSSPRDRGSTRSVQSSQSV